MPTSLPVGMTWMPNEAHFWSEHWPGFLIGGATVLALTFLAYLAAWTLGWTIEDFAGDADKNDSA